MLIENEVAYVLGELSNLPKGTKDYYNIENRFEELIAKKKSIEKS